MLWDNSHLYFCKISIFAVRLDFLCRVYRTRSHSRARKGNIFCFSSILLFILYSTEAFDFTLGFKLSDKLFLWKKLCHQNVCLLWHQKTTELNHQNAMAREKKTTSHKANAVATNCEWETCREMNRHRWCMPSCVTGNFCHLPLNLQYTRTHACNRQAHYRTYLIKHFGKFFSSDALPGRLLHAYVCACVWFALLFHFELHQPRNSKAFSASVTCGLCRKW